MRMKVALITLASLAAITLGAPTPDAEPEAFLNLGAVAIPAITGSALIDGLLLGKVAFLKAELALDRLMKKERSLPSLMTSLRRSMLPKLLLTLLEPTTTILSFSSCMTKTAMEK